MQWSPYIATCGNMIQHLEVFLFCLLSKTHCRCPTKKTKYFLLFFKVHRLFVSFKIPTEHGFETKYLGPRIKWNAKAPSFERSKLMATKFPFTIFEWNFVRFSSKKPSKHFPRYFGIGGSNFDLRCVFIVLSLHVSLSAFIDNCGRRLASTRLPS